MNKKFILMLFVLASLLFFGCVSKTYYQKVERDGSSKVKYIMDFSPLLNSLSSQSSLSTYEMKKNISSILSEECANIAQKDPSISCSVNDTMLIIEKSFDQNAGFYTFSKEEGLFEIKYKLVVNKIPENEFSLNLGNYSSQQNNQPIDLNEKDENKITASSLKLLKDFEFKYIVEMPAPIKTAYAGNYNATINGTIATFNVLSVLDDSAPLTVEATELNLPVILGLSLGVILLIIVALFLLFKKKEQGV